MKIICVGRNYKEHVLELNNDMPTAPVIFFKPESSIIQTASIPIPAFTANLHYECEVVLRINQDLAQGTAITQVKEVCDQWTLGIDFTARDMQDSLKAQKLPWELAKSFDNAALIGAWQSIPSWDIYDNRFTHLVNDVAVQNGHLKDLIFDFESIINYCLGFFSFQQGDVIFTGTPQGVGKVYSGDVLEGVLDANTVFSLLID